MPETTEPETTITTTTIEAVVKRKPKRKIVYDSVKPAQQVFTAALRAVQQSAAKPAVQTTKPAVRQSAKPTATSTANQQVACFSFSCVE